MNFQQGDLVRHRASRQLGVVTMTTESYDEMIKDNAAGPDAGKIIFVSWGFGTDHSGPVYLFELDVWLERLP